MEFKLPVIEMFGKPNSYAIQGEGKFAGTPSVFVRTFGCNLRCKFGLCNDTELADSYEKQIRKIRKIYRKHDRKFSCSALGKKFGVSKNTIYAIVSGTNWKHLLEENKNE